MDKIKWILLVLVSLIFIPSVLSLSLNQIQEPKAVLLANSIDYKKSKELRSFLEDQGLFYKVVNLF